MREHFRPSSHMRSTYPWVYLASGAIVLVAASAMAAMGWFAGHIAYGVCFAIAMDYGQERYRYRRYVHAKRIYERAMEQNETLGWD